MIIETCRIYLCAQESNYNSMKEERKIKSVLIGIGGAGCNIVESIASTFSKPFKVEVIMADTDESRLEHLRAKGFNTINLNTGIDTMIATLNECGSIYIVGSLGGKTATQFIVQLANTARELQLSNVNVIATLPFKFEGEGCELKAHSAAEMLKANNIECVLLSNDTLIEKYHDINMLNAFQISDREIMKVIETRIASRL